MKNVVLIGMPGSGKSTVGVVLAKIMGYHFLDCDLLIQEKEGRLLSEIISQEGCEGFLQAEDRIISQIICDRTIIATGGSAVYGEHAMEHLRKIGTVVYLKISYEELKKRLGDLKDRGVAMKEGQTLKELYDERIGLYEKYADVIIDQDGMQIEASARRIRYILGK